MNILNDKTIYSTPSIPTFTEVNDEFECIPFCHNHLSMLMSLTERNSDIIIKRQHLKGLARDHDNVSLTSLCFQNGG